MYDLIKINRKRIALHIRSHLFDSNISIEDFSKVIGVSKSHMQNILSQKIKRMKPKTLKTLIKYIDLTYQQAVDTAKFPKYKNEFGRLLRELRNIKGMTLVELAEGLSFSPTPQSLSSVERGKNKPYKLKTVVQISRILRLSKFQTKKLIKLSLEGRKKF